MSIHPHTADARHAVMTAAILIGRPKPLPKRIRVETAQAFRELGVDASVDGRSDVADMYFLAADRILQR